MGLYCEKCKRTMDETQFYSSKRLDKYPNGKFTKCKKCLTLHVNNWDPETFLWILEEADVPYIENKWNDLIRKYCQNPQKVTGTTVLGRYLSQMKLTQHKNDRWADTEKLNAKARAETEEALKEAENMTEEEKEKILAGGLDAAPEWNETDAEKNAKNMLKNASKTNEEPHPYDPTQDYDEDDLLILEDLTEDDRKYLLLKWGKYRPSEWVKLEQFYKDMEQSYDIQLAGHKDTLKLACKASLKANALMDIGDMEGAKKAVAMYDTLMKSGKFTAAQNKEDNGEAIDSVGEMALLCEKEGGFIPEYYQADMVNDKVDETLRDLKIYTRNLVEKEQGLGDLIESALKAMKMEDEKEDMLDVDDDSLESIEEEIQRDLVTYDDDYMEQQEFLESEIEKDLRGES